MALVVKNPPANAGDVRDPGLIPGLGKSRRGGNGNPLQYSCLENPWTEEPGGLQSTGSQSQTPLSMHTTLSLGFSGGASGKESSCQHRRHKRRSFETWVEKIPWKRRWQPTPVFSSGESHGQRSLAGYDP